jgi:CO/xanthine dehydrogenase Mo-binding subunit/aerobic-type carbon monoxide dehydrogenase small subunit (CoxS/CutS family)
MADLEPTASQGSPFEPNPAGRPGASARPECELNGLPTPLPQDGAQPVTAFLRDALGMRGTKVGCGTGDCGACTILVDGAPVYACIMPAAQLAGAKVVTAEGLCARTRCGKALQESFLAHQAVQCGYCIPGMLVTAAHAIDNGHATSPAAIRQALSGVLCRCTGYQKIVEAVDAVAQGRRCAPSVAPAAGQAIGAAVTRLDGVGKVDGTQCFGTDGVPPDALYIRAVRSPHHRARFRLGDIDRYVGDTPGVRRVFTARDVPALNLHGVATPYADQPVLPVDETRHFFEAVALVAGEAQAMRSLDLSAFPIDWTPLPPLLDPRDSIQAGAPLLHAAREQNVLIRGHVERGDARAALGRAEHVVEGHFTTSFVEHAYLEPEGGWAVRKGDVIEVHSPTQAPHSHRDDLARILGIAPEQVHVIPTAVGGGFGGKLDMTIQPLVALAAWHLDRPVAMVYTREESIATSTKRHPASMTGRIGAGPDGIIQAIEFDGDFDTGAYASWGTAVANRVPVHASGPYHVEHYRADTRAIHTHATAAGAFRGFGVPQTMVCQEQLVDELAIRLGCDPLELRLRNALRPGQTLVTGQRLEESVGIGACLRALREDWRQAVLRTRERNANERSPLRYGLGLAAFFYGCGNTALPNPSTIRYGVLPNGDVVLHQGAVDAGQGSNTVIPQIAADALGIAVHQLRCVDPSTHLTPDCGRTSASRQTFVTGKAAELAGKALRRQITSTLGVPPDTPLRFLHGAIQAVDGASDPTLQLAGLPVGTHGYVFMAEERFDPPTTGLDADGQGTPYAVYAFGAQMAEVVVDVETGVARVLRVVAAHDVGRVVNPTLLEGQVEGAVAQGVGMALMEKFVPGKANNLHDYLIPTAVDMPEVKTIFVEDRASIGPYGAKGIGEPALVPTAAAILNAIRDAIGVRVTCVPALPSVVLAALRGRAAR